MSNSTLKKWEVLLNTKRRKDLNKDPGVPNSISKGDEQRTEIERDYDRILFSTPVRRMADKTQVFPLDKNDSVRTRLTHSHEVANLGRSIGTALTFKHKIAEIAPAACRDLPSLLAAAGLVHDLGNPPFGHQGEAAIQNWFIENENPVLSDEFLTVQQRADFLKFEGNAQGFRLVTRLQILNDNFGLNLTLATLAAMMKYPIPSHEANKEAKYVGHHKHGFFASEQIIAEQVLKYVGLEMGKRHPAAYLMEACDDIAYVVLDAEDAVKKGLASFSDLMAFLEPFKQSDDVVSIVVNKSQERYVSFKNDKTSKLSPAELNDISMQMFRVNAISELVSAAIDAFLEHQEKLVIGSLESSLLGISRGETLRKQLKEFSKRHAYRHPSVLKVELDGYNVIKGLLDIFWAAIVDREDPSDPASTRNHPFSKYVYGCISENYRRVFESSDAQTTCLPMRYRECLLLTDMISGMTDGFAVDLYRELSAMRGDYNSEKFLAKVQ